MNVPVQRFLGGSGILFHLLFKSYVYILSTFHKNVLSTDYVPNPILGFVV